MAMAAGVEVCFGCANVLVGQLGPGDHAVTTERSKPVNLAVQTTLRIKR